MARNVCITAVDGQTGFLIAELVLTHPDFASKIDSVTGLAMHPASAKARELAKLGARIVPHKPGRERDVAQTLAATGCDTICLVPPAHRDKLDIVVELVRACRRAGVPNVCFVGSAGCDYADPRRQPRLREFLDMETLVLSAKGDPSTALGHSPCVIRAGFYAENLLLYSPQATKEGLLPLPIGTEHKFAPVALGDVAQVAAHVITGKGPHGFDDKHRGQLMVVTGPTLATGDELAAAASAALGTPLRFEDISPAEAKRALHAQSHSDESEKEYLLEYYGLVREGKANYVATAAFVNVTGARPEGPEEFFSAYRDSFVPKEHHREATANKKRKTADGGS